MMIKCLRELNQILRVDLITYFNDARYLRGHGVSSRLKARKIQRYMYIYIFFFKQNKIKIFFLHNFWFSQFQRAVDCGTKYKLMHKKTSSVKK